MHFQTKIPLLILGAMGAVAILHSCASQSLRPFELREPQSQNPQDPAVLAWRLGLVSIAEADPTIKIEQRYATSNNITGKPIYPANLPCLVQKETMHKLHRAQQLLQDEGYGLKVWDAYRPPEAHWILWEASKGNGYVHEPGYDGRWSWHCYGRAVDVTLVDKNGNEALMPSDFDDFTPKAWTYARDQKGKAKSNRERLHRAMRAAGFEPLESEWWHFADEMVNIPKQPIWGRQLGLNFGSMEPAKKIPATAAEPAPPPTEESGTIKKVTPDGSE